MQEEIKSLNMELQVLKVFQITKAQLDKDLRANHKISRIY